MNDKYLVSVIMPVYNVAAYLSEALDSVVNQSYDNLEIIVIDDGSTDGSEKICDEYAEKDKRIRLIHQKNSGVSSTRNAALDAVTGDFVLFIDSDDAYDPDYVSTMLNAMTENDADMAICRFTIHTTTGVMKRTGTEELRPPIGKGLYNRVEAMQAFAANTIHAYLWNKMYRKELWNDIRFPIGMLYEDIDVMYRIINLCDRICVIDNPLYLYRKRPGSITEQKTADSIKDWLTVCERMETFVEDNIPDIYTSDHLKIMKQDRLRRMIIYYDKFIPQKGEGSGEFRKWMRKQIIELKKKVGFRNCSFVMKASYYIIWLCPWLMRLLTPLYWVFNKNKRI
ncbi:MAG: glycosyltransferase family 2 protein [Clostridia bacterium]|nr:glycosyltransferase family 2 protein [Clostridia bacterium]